MDEELGARYADLVALFAERAAHANTDALAIDPATIVAVVLAIDEHGEAVGHVALRDHRRDGTRDDEVKRLFVRDRARGTGASRALLAELERLATARGAERLVLQTGERQQDAIALYRRAGYTPIPVYEPYERIPGSHCFEKRLATDERRP
ncbi:GNAT family N-acetyltransferase [Pseudoclavibacter chungangensis]|uniref:GNAT family N-acetyltransferase n=2 Tax=Pseudoclavibacter chungangensis TaxID=587635 RepID=A0A7J5C1B9_9MICO|nr:GNAT family N-acetyltransferase [Pseudoclavibacter chungangensis]